MAHSARNTAAAASHPATGSVSPLGAGINLVNTIIGSGVLALPYALREAGFYFGILVLIAAALLSNLALNLLIYSGRRQSQYKYEDAASAALGRPGHYLLAFALTTNSIGSCISYLIIIGDLGAALVEFLCGATGASSWWASRQAVILISACILTLPLLFFRTLEPLVRPSAISVLCMPVIVLIVAIRAPAYTVPDHPAPTPVWGPSILPAIGVIAFAYACAQTSFQSYQTLAHKTLDAWTTATRFATTLAMVIYVAFAVISYRAFGLETQPNLLNNFASDDGLANVARGLLAFSLALTYPMQFYPIRDLFADALGISIDTSPAKVHGLSLVLFAGTVATAMAVKDLGFVFKLIGTAAASLLVFGLPGVIYLGLASPYRALWLGKREDGGAAIAIEGQPLLPQPATSNSQEDGDGSGDRARIPEPSTSIMSLVLVLLGAGVFVIGTWSAIREYVAE
ncbi:hypothetical protein GGI07_000558 [Coemansia sp. Benny D115]|nr:hypothetical protein GGI07_000558 [Coemansia sp. Benny D115]